MKLTKVCFFVLLTVIAPSINIGNSGAYLWDDSTPFLLECRIPANSSRDSINVNLTQEEIEQVNSEGRCFSTCVAHTKYSDKIGMKNYSLSDYWPFIDDSEIQCDISAEVHECTCGCVRALGKNENARICSPMCAKSCLNECDPLLSYCHLWIHAGCPIPCAGCPGAEMKDLFTDALLKAICDRLEVCSEIADIGLRDPTIICPTSDSKIGTFSATLSGTNARKKLESIEQLSEDLSVDLGSGLVVTLSVCDDDCPMPLGESEPSRHVQSSGLLAGVIISVIFLSAMVIAAAILSTVIVFKYNKLTHHKEPYTSLPNTDETDTEQFDRLQQHQSNVNIESSRESELCYPGSSCNESASVQDSPISSDDQMLLNNPTNQVWQHNADHDQGYCSTSDQCLNSKPAFQSRYFIEADRNAQVPFVYHQLVVCDCSGREYTIANHDITLKIPDGAVPKGQKIHFEVAVAMYGPFTFPNNTQPISPILWLCIVEEDVELKKPFNIIVPHFLAGLTKDQLLHHQAYFAKASHYKYILQNEQIFYEFLPSEDKSGFAFNGCRGYGVLEANHCCFYCLLANTTSEVAKDAGYCLARIESSLTLQRSEVYFTAIYFLDSCLKSLEEQFPSEEGYRICRYDDFKFKDNESGEPHIKVVAPSEHNQCVIGMEPMTAEIRASDIDFWSKEFEDMRRRHQRKMYPPRVKMTVSLRNPDLTLKIPVRFTGCLSDNQLDVELTFPLGFVWSQSLSLSTVSSASGGSQAIIYEKPKLKDVFKELLPQATEWKTIGTLLGVEEHVLDKIKCDEEGTRDRLQKMLSEWLKQADPLPTWMELAEAMEAVDVLKAKELKARSADIV